MLRSYTLVIPMPSEKPVTKLVPKVAARLLMELNRASQPPPPTGKQRKP